MLKSHSRDYVIDRVYQSRQKHLSKLWSFYSRCAFKFEVIQATLQKNPTTRTLHRALIAQWESVGLANQRSGVRSSLGANIWQPTTCETVSIHQIHQHELKLLQKVLPWLPWQFIRMLVHVKIYLVL